MLTQDDIQKIGIDIAKINTYLSFIESDIRGEIRTDQKYVNEIRKSAQGILALILEKQGPGHAAPPFEDYDDD